MELLVNMERRGKLRRVGTIRGQSAADSRFSYAGDYLRSADSAPVSLSLPLREMT